MYIDPTPSFAACSVVGIEHVTVYPLYVDECGNLWRQTWATQTSAWFHFQTENISQPWKIFQLCRYGTMNWLYQNWNMVWSDYISKNHEKKDNLNCCSYMVSRIIIQCQNSLPVKEQGVTEMEVGSMFFFILDLW